MCSAESCVLDETMMGTTIVSFAGPIDPRKEPPKES
jgi:hypothetical protein